MPSPNRRIGSIIAVLHTHNKSIAGILSLAQSCLQNMQNNPRYQSIIPLLDKVKTQHDKLYNAWVTSKTRTIGTYEVMRQELVEMKYLLQQLCTSVGILARQNKKEARSIIEGAGMKIKKTSGSRKRIFSVSLGKHLTSVKLRSPAILRSTCIYQMTTTPMIASSWTTIYTGPNVEFETSQLADGVYYFRYANNVKGKMTGWSHVLKLTTG